LACAMYWYNASTVYCVPRVNSLPSHSHLRRSVHPV
jgi:hypothetical protein